MGSSNWRAVTFDQLKLAGAGPRWPGYAAYARLQERGLRDDSLREVRRFADQLSRQPLSTRWEFVSWLCGEILGPRVITQPVVPFPLRTKVVVPTLLEAVEALPGDPRATLWLVSRFQEDLAEACPDDPDRLIRMLRDQLERTPDAVAVRRMLADLLLGRVEEDAHDLAESVYLGDPDTNQSRFAEIRDLLAHPSLPVDVEDPILTEAGREQELFDAWQAFRLDGDADFPAWCLRRGIEPPGGNTCRHRE